MTKERKDTLRLRFRVAAWVYLAVILIVGAAIDIVGVGGDVFKALAMVTVPSLVVVMTADLATSPK